jgi:hypothetical protein
LIMERLAAREAIRELLYRYAQAEDELDGHAFQSLCSPDQPTVLDFTAHLPGHPVMRVTPAECWDMLYNGLAGFTATQHLFTNAIITFDDEDDDSAACSKARVMAKGLAQHFVQDDDGAVRAVVAHGDIIADVEVVDSTWVFRKIVIKRDVPMANAGLYGEAAQRVKEGKGRKAKGAV